MIAPRLANRGLMHKAMRETIGVTLILGAVLAAVETAFGFVLPTFQQQFGANFPKMDLFKNMLKAVLGTEIPPDLAVGPEMLQSLTWVHPVILALVWAHAVLVCTRVPAGEVDRGTIDILLGLPVSRWQVIVSESLVWVASGIVLLGFLWAGHAIGAMAGPADLRSPDERVILVLLNLFTLYLAVGAIAWLLSSLCDRRGSAITGVFLILVAMLALNYLAQFWAPLRGFAWMSLLHYYRPLRVLQEGDWPVGDIGVLLGVATAFWALAGWIFSRRDLCTV